MVLDKKRSLPTNGSGEEVGDGERGGGAIEMETQGAIKSKIAPPSASAFGTGMRMCPSFDVGDREPYASDVDYR